MAIRQKVRLRVLGINDSKKISASFSRKAEPVQIGLQVGRCAVAAEITVHSRHRGRINQIISCGINPFEFLQQISLAPQSIFLVIIFGTVKSGEGQNLGLNPLLPLGRFALSALFGQFFLLIGVIKDCGHVLLRPSARVGVVILPEDVQKVVVGNLGGVVIDLDRLRVVTQAVVCRRVICTASIAHAGPHHTLQTPEPGVGPPESAQSEGGCCGLKRFGSIDGWNCSRYFFSRCGYLHNFCSF